MQSLKQLKSGQLAGTKTLKLSEQLTSFPKEIFNLSDTLEHLDLTDNKLSSLPDDFCRLKRLKILFLSNNYFTEFPTVLAKCPMLCMIGIRNNRIKAIAENSIPLSTRWLILTDNEITKLPDSMGELGALQKCMLSGNRLGTLPSSMAYCHNLELLRISANRLDRFPQFLLTLPRLAWLAYGGNLFCAGHPDSNTVLDEIPWSKLKIKEVLGEGASGVIYKALYKNKEVALKVFKAEMTSDGLPQDEMGINIALGRHPHLINVLARVVNHPKGSDVLMLEMIPSRFFNLGLPPTFKTCTRDIYPDEFSLSFAHVVKILQDISGAVLYMHSRGIMHGDLYAHNIMIDTDGSSILGDFGGASYYNHQETEIRNGLERLEVRAFGYLIEELLNLCKKENIDNKTKSDIMLLKERCLDLQNKNRPDFEDIHRYLTCL